MLLTALELHVPKSLSYPGGMARSGEYGTVAKMVKVDVPSPTDRKLDHTRPDVVVRLRKEAVTYILDVACPWEGGVQRREAAKRQKYQALAADLANQWGHRVKVIPVVIGVLGTVKNARTLLKEVHFLNSQQISHFLATAQRETVTSAVQIIKRHMTA